MSNQDDGIRRAQHLLEAPDLLDRAARFMDDLGLCGEDANRRMVFLAGVGGMLGEPIHLIIKGDSSGGKNTLVKAAMSLLPESMVLATSGLSPQALLYYGEGEGEKKPAIEGVLLIDEAEGLKGAEYIIRQAMSEGRVNRLTVGKDESGRWGGKKLEVKITASIITTTTETALHRENQTRVFDLWIDESQEQTRQVLRAQARRAAGGVHLKDVEEELEIWREALGQLQPSEVVVPYACDLAEAFPTIHLRMRRDYDRVLTLIKVSAMLHQEQRGRSPDGRVIASLEDYEVVYPLIQSVLEPSMQGLNAIALQLSDLRDELAQRGSGWVKRIDLETEAGKRRIATRNTVHKWCKQLYDLGYWDGRHEYNGGWEYLKLRDPREEPVVLPRPEDLDRPGLPRGPNSVLGRSYARDGASFWDPPSASTEEAGNQATTETLRRVYQQPDSETMLRVVLEPVQLRGAT